MAVDEFKKYYWASVSDSEIADEMLDKVQSYYKYLSLSGRLDLYRRSWAYYYRPRLTGARLNPVGQQGELTALSVNQFRNLLSHLETMANQQKVAFESRASNTDVKSQAQTIFSNALLEYYFHEKGIGTCVESVIKKGLMFADGFVELDWNPFKGTKYGVLNNRPVYTGDVSYRTYMPIDVIRDFSQINTENEDWHILRTFENKYDLAAKYPNVAKEVLNDSVDMLQVARTTTLNALALEESDNVAVYTLKHKRTPAMPEGRYTKILDNRTLLMDGPLPYQDIDAASTNYIYRFYPDVEEGTIFGYSVAFDLLSIQEALDIVYSTSTTNFSTFGVQNVLMPKGSDISPSQLAGGLNVINYDPRVGKPEGLNLTQMPDGLFPFMQHLEHLGEIISGVNSVARGNPEASLKSGAALALVQSMAVQFSMGLTKNRAKIIGDIGTGTVYLLKQFGKADMLAAISGRSKKQYLKYFKGTDLSSINRVQIDLGNPLTNTLAGRVNLAEMMIDKGLIKNPQQFNQVIETGRIETMTGDITSEEFLIAEENEKLSDGKPVRAIISDMHVQHILGHRAVASNTDVRANPNDPILINLFNHIQEHIDLLQNMSPILAQVLQQPVFALPPAPGMPQQGDAEMLNAENPLQQEAGQVNLPNMPSPPANADPLSAAIIQSEQQQGVAI